MPRRAAPSPAHLGTRTGRVVGWAWIVALAACQPLGDDRPPISADHMLCTHVDVPCSSCHPADAPPGPLDPTCVSCHDTTRPLTHPDSAEACATCHTGCGWEGAAGVHPEGFDAAAAHGVAANLQADPTGDCAACHGADLAGGTSPDGWQAPGCDSCHADNGHADWRTDCTFCHGGEGGDVLGAPPQDLDNTTDPASVSFQAHATHVAVGDHPTWTCDTCHPVVTDLLDPGHVRDDTPGAAEVDFTAGTSPNARWDGTSCSDSWCHGNGQIDGAVLDGLTPLSCDGCHGTTQTRWADLSPVHSDHLLGDPTISCTSCHAHVVDALGDVVGPDLHVDGALEVAFAEPGMTPGATPLSCDGTCHGVVHTGGGVGHPPGYDAPDVHGLDSNLQVSDCTTCHGADLTGGAFAPGCDTCHAQNGHPDWRTDCTFCHGGEGGDLLGAPPEDIDNNTNPATITFQAHQTHVAVGDHPTWTCDTCHPVVTDLLDPGHLRDATHGHAEVDFTAGTSPNARWDGTSCSDSWCHGNGQVDGAVLDGLTPLSCDGCHGTTQTRWADLSPVHSDHLLGDPTISCTSCHADVVDALGDVVGPDLHVDGTLEVAFADPGMTPGTTPLSCDGTCHGVVHTGGVVGHPPGYDAPDVHGLDSNLQVSDCTTCHGADLTGGAFAPGCDTCHAQNGHPDWRTDCTFCHGGDNGDVLGAPPEDIDNNTNPATITFQAHQTHVAVGDHPTWTCDTCHPVVADLLAPGHLRDSTPGTAELDFTAGTSPTARWNGTSCSDAWCHGNGVTPGAVADGLTPLTCNGCHGTTPARWPTMSAIHDDHLAADPTISCASCHADVVDAAGVVVGPDLHVDGALEVAFAQPGMTPGPTPLTCSGTCHGVDHVDGVVGHPPGYDAPDVHGLDANLQRTDCRTCHGADLTGGPHAPGCDSCHSLNGHPDWRTDCTFCHGGSGGDTTGAPPQDIDNTVTTQLLAFMAHRIHLDPTRHATYTCGTCHGVATDLYTQAPADPGHIFDGTPGRSEVAFTGIATGGAWVAGTSTCTNQYCHGNGQNTVSIADGTTSLSCHNSCHADRTSTSDAWQRMSGNHKHHLEQGYACAECHADVTDSSQTIIGPALHVDGDPDIAFLNTNVTLNANGTCSGTCHGERHQNERW
ncbi:MAG: hypothetical protein H6733_16935 [Alphaproteobacteria bacterium]|nr:hypothetical protein [Alphaproteobacteria bacterium]